MVSIITTVLGFLGPFIKWGIQSLINSGKVSDDDKQWLIEADKILSQRNFNDIKRAKDLEKKLPGMDQEMDDIAAGKVKPPWENSEEDQSKP